MSALADHITGGDVYEWDVYDGVAEQKLYGPDNPLLIEPERLAVDFKVYSTSVERNFLPATCGVSTSARRAPAVEPVAS